MSASQKGEASSTATSGTTTPLTLVDDENPAEKAGKLLDAAKDEKTVVVPVLEDQSTRMPLRKILVVYLGIGLALFVAFVDQTAVSTAAPVISTDLRGSETMSWIGTSFFVASCAFQLVYGRLSDIFGRKWMLEAALAFLALGDLLCSFAQTPIQLYIFRGIAGIGGGGVTNVAMVIVSDIVPLKERGKYQGFVSAACSLGNAVGPFVGGGFGSVGQWRWLFRVIAIAAVVAAAVLWYIVPLKPVSGSVKEKMKQIDYLGVTLSSAAALLLLIPISGGGSTFAWSSPMVITMLVLGGALSVAFILCEWKLAKLPILPLRIFKSRTPALVMAQSFFLGAIYYGNIYYVPVFLQYVKQTTSLVSGALLLAYILPQAGWGILAGFFVSKTNHYKLVLIVGSVLWTLGLGLQLLWKAETSIGEVIGFLEISAIGVGWNLQTTLVAALATTKHSDRAVVTGSRNFFRTMGASFGLAAANAIYQTKLISELNEIPDLSVAQRAQVREAALADLDRLSPTTRGQIYEAYSDSLRVVFAMFVGVAGVLLVLALFIREVRFKADNELLQAEKTRNRAQVAPDKVVEQGDTPPEQKT